LRRSGIIDNSRNFFEFSGVLVNCKTMLRAPF
jgi:hypothetical protein